MMNPCKVSKMNGQVENKLFSLRYRTFFRMMKSLLIPQLCTNGVCTFLRQYVAQFDTVFFWNFRFHQPCTGRCVDHKVGIPDKKRQRQIGRASCRDRGWQEWSGRN